MRIHIDARNDPHNAMDKIRLKRAPKQYKSGVPGLAGRAKLEQQMRTLALKLHRFAKKAAPRDADWARRCAEALIQDANIFANVEPL